MGLMIGTTCLYSNFGAYLLAESQGKVIFRDK